MKNTIFEIESRSTQMALVSTSAGGIATYIRLLSPGNTGMIVDLSHRKRAVTLNDMARASLIARNYNVNTVVLVTNVGTNFNFNDAFPNCWTCWLPVTTSVIDASGRYALSYNYIDDHLGMTTSYIDIAYQQHYQNEYDFYSQFQN